MERSLSSAFSSIVAPRVFTVAWSELASADWLVNVVLARAFPAQAGTAELLEPSMRSGGSAGRASDRSKEGSAKVACGHEAAEGVACGRPVGLPCSRKLVRWGRAPLLLINRCIAPYAILMSSTSYVSDHQRGWATCASSVSYACLGVPPTSRPGCMEYGSASHCSCHAFRPAGKGCPGAFAEETEASDQTELKG